MPGISQGSWLGSPAELPENHMVVSILALQARHSQPEVVAVLLDTLHTRLTKTFGLKTRLVRPQNGLGFV